MKKIKDYEEFAFPASRILTMDSGRIGLGKHHVKALLEIDVTEAKGRIKAIKAEEGAVVSFTSWIVRCIAIALSEHREVHALGKGRLKGVRFDSVDISLLVEKVVNGMAVPLPLVIRGADRKSVSEICREILEAKSRIIETGDEFVIGRDDGGLLLKLYSLLPQSLRLAAWRFILRNPFRARRMMGTAVVTSLGMIGSADGWIIPYSIHPVCFALGSINRKPGVVNDAVEIREYLKMTVLLDHDVVDGAPAARFVSRLVELVEQWHGL